MFRIFTTVWLALIIAVLTLSSCILSHQTPPRDTQNSSEIDNEFVKKHLKMLKNPRIMTVGDVKDENEREAFVDLGYSFVVKGDLNKDGYIDYAIVGKYDGPYPDRSLFVAVVSLKEGKSSLEFLHKIRRPHDRAFLKIEPGSRLYCKGVDKTFDVVFVAMSLWTEDAWCIAWNGRKYFITYNCWYLPEEESKPPVQPSQ
jgi:hypothetical protein